jgi:uncharacterized membrane protein YoaK (UPF0700 family)
MPRGAPAAPMLARFCHGAAMSAVLMPLFLNVMMMMVMIMSTMMTVSGLRRNANGQKKRGRY